MSGKAGDNYEGLGDWGEPQITQEQVEAAHKIVLSLQEEMNNIGYKWDDALKANNKPLAGELQTLWLGKKDAEHEAYAEYATLKAKYERQQRK